MNNNSMNTSTMSFDDFFSEVECLNEGSRSKLVSHSEIWRKVQKDFSSEHTWVSSKSELAKQRQKELNDELRANSIVNKSFSEGLSAEYQRMSKGLRELSRAGIDNKLVRLVATLHLVADEPEKFANESLNGNSMQHNTDLLAIAAMTSELLDEHLTQANQHKFEVQKLHGIAEKEKAELLAKHFAQANQLRLEAEKLHDIVEQEKAEKLSLQEENQQLHKTKAALQQRISHNSRQNRRTKNLKH